MFEVNNEIKVFNRADHKLLATWSIAEQGKKPTALAFDEAGHRLFVGTRDPGKLIVLDSDSGKVVASMPAGPMVDDMAFDSASRRIYFAASQFIDVFQQRDATLIITSRLATYRLRSGRKPRSWSQS